MARKRTPREKFEREEHAPFAEIPYGFRWGPCEVERTISADGHVVLTIRTPRTALELRVTPTGLIRQLERPLRLGEWKGGL